MADDVTIRDVANHMARVMDLSAVNLLGNDRAAAVTRPRFALMLVAVRKMGIKNSAVGRRLGKHHTTILHGVDRAVAELAAKDELTTRAYKIAIRYVVQRRREARALTATKGAPHDKGRDDLGDDLCGQREHGRLDEGIGTGITSRSGRGISVYG